MDPLDPSVLLLAESKFQVRTLTSVMGLGFLEAHNKSSDLSPNARFDVPLWLADAFVSKGLVTVDQPDIFGKHLVPLLERAPLTANLKAKHPHYFKLGTKYTALIKDSSLYSTLLFAASARYQAIAKLLASGAVLTDEAEQETMTNFCKDEEKFFREGKIVNSEFHEWRRQENRKMKPVDGSLIPREVRNSYVLS